MIVERENTVDWLLKQDNPAIRYWTLKDLLDKREGDQELAAVQNKIASWAPIANYLEGQNPHGYWGFEEDVYWPKWRATVWALILLGELGVSGSSPLVRKSCEFFLKRMGEQDRTWPPPRYPDDDLRGWRAVWEPCVTGNMARTLAVFGYGSDPRVREMFEWLVKCQRDDGGWNCETEESRNGEEVHHSSFMSTIEPLWAFSSLDPQLWPKGGKTAVEQGCEFLLMHKLFKSDKTGKVIREEWTRLHFPMFYFYDILHGLRVLTKLGFGHDNRTEEALSLLLSKRLPDGTWPMEASYLRALRRNFVKDETTGQWHEEFDQTIDVSKIYTVGSRAAQIPGIYFSLGEVGRSNAWVTLNALRVLKSIDGQLG